MDGNEFPVSNMPPSNTADAMIYLASRLGGIEQALRGNVTHEKLMQTWNDLRRDVQGMVRDNEVHVRGMIEASDTRADKRIQDLQLALEQVFSNRIPAAVKSEFKAEKEREDEARKQVENKAKDAVRGFRLVMAGKNAIIGGGFVLAALFVLKMTFGWSSFG